MAGSWFVQNKNQIKSEQEYSKIEKILTIPNQKIWAIKEQRKNQRTFNFCSQKEIKTLKKLEIALQNT